MTRTKRSAYNPEALPERTIREARVFEFGPVTFPACAATSAGLRSSKMQPKPVAPPRPTPAIRPRHFSSNEQWLAYLATLRRS